MPMRSSTSDISIRRSTIRSVSSTLSFIGRVYSSEYRAPGHRDDRQSPLPERPLEQRTVLVGGHGEADGLIDVAQPGGALVLGGEALTLDLLPGSAPNPVGHPLCCAGPILVHPYRAVRLKPQFLQSCFTSKYERGKVHSRPPYPSPERYNQRRIIESLWLRAMEDYCFWKPGSNPLSGAPLSCLLAALEATLRLRVHLGGKYSGCQPSPL